MKFIVIDDGSTDDTPATLRPYMQQIRYFRQENLGASATRNKGVELATGEWVAILASDDSWLPEKLEAQVVAVTRMGEAYGACFTDCQLFDGKNSLAPRSNKQTSLPALNLDRATTLSGCSSPLKP